MCLGQTYHIKWSRVLSSQCVSSVGTDAGLLHYCGINFDSTVKVMAIVKLLFFPFVLNKE